MPTRVEIRLEKDELARLDNARGLASRAAFVKSALETTLSLLEMAPEKTAKPAPAWEQANRAARSPSLDRFR